MVFSNLKNTGWTSSQIMSKIGECGIVGSVKWLCEALVIYASSLATRACAKEIYNQWTNNFKRAERRSLYFSLLHLDLAFKKKTEQSSTAYNGFSSRAVDENYSSQYNDKSCTHTNKEQNPWWRVDLGREYIVTGKIPINNKFTNEKRKVTLARCSKGLGQWLALACLIVKFFKSIVLWKDTIWDRGKMFC